MNGPAFYALPLDQRDWLTNHRLDNDRFRHKRLAKFPATVVYEDEQSARVAQEEAEEQMNAPYMDQTLVYWMAASVR